MRRTKRGDEPRKLRGRGTLWPARATVARAPAETPPRARGPRPGAKAGKAIDFQRLSDFGQRLGAVGADRQEDQLVAQPHELGVALRRQGARPSTVKASLGSIPPVLGPLRLTNDMQIKNSATTTASAAPALDSDLNRPKDSGRKLAARLIGPSASFRRTRGEGGASRRSGASAEVAAGAALSGAALSGASLAGAALSGAGSGAASTTPPAGRTAGSNAMGGLAAPGIGAAAGACGRSAFDPPPTARAFFGSIVFVPMIRKQRFLATCRKGGRGGGHVIGTRRPDGKRLLSPNSGRDPGAEHSRQRNAQRPKRGRRK